MSEFGMTMSMAKSGLSETLNQERLGDCKLPSARVTRCLIEYSLILHVEERAVKKF